ncbi:hypothetical protein [Streptomyces sp. NPDC013457]|uniref:hypothetical protein n=1 Tax=Streptomyces sp. NPDC013457 TaxID=3364866 RepID=UPI0036F7DD6A
MTVATEAGMIVLWDSQWFAAVVDDDGWEDELLEDEDIVRHIQAGALVPLTCALVPLIVGGDGAFGVLVRSGTEAAPAGLTERRRPTGWWLPVPTSSSPTAAHWSAASSTSVGTSRAVWSSTPCPRAARRTVVVHLIDWQAEAGSQDETGKPLPGALPDFVVLINHAQPGRDTCRTAVQTFEAPNG